MARWVGHLGNGVRVRLPDAPDRVTALAQARRDYGSGVVVQSMASAEVADQDRSLARLERAIRVQAPKGGRPTVEEGFDDRAG